MANSIKVVFSDLRNGTSTSITLYSRFTCLYGKESGEGKSHFVSVIQVGLGLDKSKPTLSVDIDNPEYTFKTAVTQEEFRYLVENTGSKYIILVDEAQILWDYLEPYIKRAEHIFICVTRGYSFSMMYPIHGLYKIVRTIGDENADAVYNFTIERLQELPVVKDISERFDYIVTESSLNHSEHELLNLYFNNIVTAKGRDRLHMVLDRLSKKEPGCKILVFADLGNIGPAYQLLLKQALQNTNIRFYNYLCFEQLLLSSSLVKSLNRKSNISRFVCKSLENYYSKRLEVETYKTELEYRHGKPLKPGYKLPENFHKLYSSKVSKVLKQYIEKYRDK